MAKPRPLTEGELVKRLVSRYSGDNGNGPAGAVIPQVRDAAGFDAGRTIDAIGMHFWPSRGLLIDGFECKSSRSDWTRELENCEKADAFCKLVDRFYVVFGRADLVKLDEVPPDWGVLVPFGEDRLKEIKPAVVLHHDTVAVEEWARIASGRRSKGPRPLPPGFNRSFLVALLRAATRTVDVSREIRAARDEGYSVGFEEGQRQAGRDLVRLRSRDEERAEFERETGIPIGGYRTWGPGGGIHTPADVGKAVRRVLDGEVDLRGLRNQLSAATRNAERLAADARQRLSELDALMGIEGECPDPVG